MKLFQKADFCFLDSGGWVRMAVSLTHTGLKVVLTAFEAFRSEHSKQTK